jgi:hypothetical protein
MLAAVSIEARATGGAYATSTVGNAAACERLCADDGLCAAWSFHQDNSCELRATEPVEARGVASGLSRRALHALRRASTETGGSVALVEATPAANVEPPQAQMADAPAPAASPEDDLSQLLLGGLEEDATGLRN